MTLFSRVVDSTLLTAGIVASNISGSTDTLTIIADCVQIQTLFICFTLLAYITLRNWKSKIARNKDSKSLQQKQQDHQCQHCIYVY